MSARYSDEDFMVLAELLFPKEAQDALRRRLHDSAAARTGIEWENLTTQERQRVIEQWQSTRR
jgi:hypothetical protein